MRKVTVAQRRFPPLLVLAGIALIGILVIFVALHKTYGGKITITESELNQAVGSNNGLLERNIQIDKAGEYFTVTLYTQFDAGMRWSATVADTSIVKSLGFKYIPDHDSRWWWPWGASTGGPGKEIWTFKALSPGSTEISMTYYSIGGPRVPNTLNISVVIFQATMGH